MSTGAIIMMIVAITVVWGGLVASILLLRRFPEAPEED
ncbi:methionine/alanine import family NSS transporter small subunit [Nocardia cyriacigeorgica]|nr:methionine/alanine import family NSS transporter small subunit [Nocardia cyriacigeorgica]MBF6157349.1 methionine/alanine import family NSS transporter small subunit [Nocardia cyriacigeorgica]MBF6196320.1 methionine/alanine import family NSS transporter small subunit [Nocardia cyriacigeorgica]MBF6346170.1 methionine/alanine import family NSS transporter small subunit [Nocardia cyriacigeorgica]MBF6517490.1 methionine/alanine import family NSS transporter small subunit [Nocardia cyriacigeorgica